jgi:hypothetical protein
MAGANGRRVAFTTMITTFTLLCGITVGVSPDDTSAREHQVPNVWVYSLVATDYDAYKMLPHFLKHYHSLGVPHSNFQFDLLHDPTEPETGLKASSPFALIVYLVNLQSSS